MQVLFDVRPDAVAPIAGDWEPEPMPSAAEITAVAVRDVVTQPLEMLRVPSLSGLKKVPMTLAGVAFAAKELVPQQIAQYIPGQGEVVPTSMNGPLGPNRRWVWTSATMAEVKAIKGALGGTVNDVILAAITRGYRDLLLGRGELTPDMVVRSLVPVSTRLADGRGQLNNQVTSVVVDLPVGEADPANRLASVRYQMDRNKRGMMAVDAAAIVALADFAAPTLLALGARSMSMVPNKLVQTGTTNVPGPRFPLYVLGRQLVESHPYVPVFGGVRVAVGIFSYLDTFSFGITADFDSFPDVEVIADGIRRGFDELVEVAGPAEVAAAVAPAPVVVPVKRRPPRKRATPKT
jgi:WS/DGAT/MGAT family acyltransferase